MIPDRSAPRYRKPGLAPGFFFYAARSRRTIASTAVR